MANGFLDRAGNFMQANNYNHFEIARRLLKDLKHGERHPLEPPDVLCNKYGFVYFREHFNGLAGGVREENLDGVWMSKTFFLSEDQCKWIGQNLALLSDRQKILINEILQR